jgi:Skp family chaperone for outer membrane proteins
LIQGIYMKKITISLLIIFACKALLLPCIAAADFTIATVNVNQILNESKEAQEKKKELDKLSTQAKKKVDDKKKSLQAMEQKIKDGAVAEDSTEAKNFRNDARDFARYVKDTEGDLRNEFLKSNKTLTEKALNIVANYAKTNNIDLVIDRSDSSRGPVLYSVNTADITEAIIKKMNE